MSSKIFLVFLLENISFWFFPCWKTSPKINTIKHPTYIAASTRHISSLNLKWLLIVCTLVFLVSFWLKICVFIRSSSLAFRRPSFFPQSSAMTSKFNNPFPGCSNVWKGNESWFNEGNGAWIKRNLIPSNLGIFKLINEISRTYIIFWDSPEFICFWSQCKQTQISWFIEQVFLESVINLKKIQQNLREKWTLSRSDFDTSLQRSKSTKKRNPETNCFTKRFISSDLPKIPVSQWL